MKKPWMQATPPAPGAWGENMAQFCLTLAGHTGAFTSLFESTPVYLGTYVTENTPEFSFTVTREHLLFEADALYREALEEGFRPRTFTDPFLERAAIQRAFAEYLFDFGILPVHGSTLAADGKAYLFAARSGTGKSTHTRLWKQLLGDRVFMINDDRPFLEVTDTGVIAHGTPWSGKHGLDTNVSVPLGGICLLERGSENAIAPTNPEALLAFLRHEAYCPLAPEKEEAFLAVTEALANTVPLWHMHCRPDLKAADMAFSAMSRSQQRSDLHEQP